MKIKTSDLTGPALDWAVAKAIGYALYKDAMLDGCTKEGWWLSGINPDPNAWVHISAFYPSANWSQGGPIIDKYNISIGHHPYCVCPVFVPDKYGGHYKTYGAAGLTNLIAAMRCFVASKLGDEVDVPEELI